MRFISDEAWRQIKNIRHRELVRALEKDGWERDIKRGARLIYVKLFPNGKVRRVSIHYHPTKTFPPGTLKSMLEDIGWTDEDLIDLRLIK